MPRREHSQMTVSCNEWPAAIADREMTDGET
jgi:hypothetical protein